MQKVPDQQRRKWMSLPSARVQIAQHLFGDPAAHEFGLGEEAETLHSRTREQLEEADRLLYRALLDRKVVAYWRAQTLDPARAPIDASDLEEPRVWELVIKARRVPNGLSNPTLALHASHIVEVPEDELLRWLDKIHPALDQDLQKGGRPPVVEWKLVSGEVNRLMDHHGGFDSGDKEWDCQARLEEKIQEFCKRRFGIEPGGSTVRRRIKPALEAWRTYDAQN